MAFIYFFLKKIEKVEKQFFWLILRFSNLNVLHKGLLMQDKPNINKKSIELSKVSKLLWFLSLKGLKRK